MGNRFFAETFTPAVRAEQIRHGSRDAYARLESIPGSGATGGALRGREAEFIGARDSFYLATVSENGWPYIQHRGGPAGFVKALDDGDLAWPDFVGNRQYVSIGNAATADRVALFFMDYPNQLRLKVLGHIQVLELGEDPDLAARLDLTPYRGAVEHYIRVTVDAFDWNCPQHISPRFTAAEIEAMVTPLHARIAELEQALAASVATR
jgi:predicted pyridoxine 5'-phosphate oxidase superfamily flavin-nucleotide-binding protein